MGWNHSERHLRGRWTSGAVDELVSRRELPDRQRHLPSDDDPFGRYSHQRTIGEFGLPTLIHGTSLFTEARGIDNEIHKQTISHHSREQTESNAPTDAITQLERMFYT